jgi:hypothetical protein
MATDERCLDRERDLEDVPGNDSMVDTRIEVARIVALEILARDPCRECDRALEISHRMVLTRLNRRIVGQIPVKENGEGNERLSPRNHLPPMGRQMRPTRSQCATRLLSARSP